MASLTPRVFFYLAFVVGILGVSGCNSSPVPVFLGHLHARSAPLQENDPILQGIDLALRDSQEDFKKEFKGRPLQVRHGDAKGDPDLLESQAVRFAYLHRTPIQIGGETPDEVRRLDRSKAVVFSPLGTPVAGVSDSVFYLGVNPADQARALAGYAWEDLKLAKLRLLHEIGTLATEGFWEKTKSLKKDSNVTASESRHFVSADLVQEVQKEPTLLTSGQTFPLVDELLLQTRARAVGLPSALSEVLKGPVLSVEGKLYVAVPFDPGSESEEWKAFRGKYHEAFSTEPTWSAQFGFECVRIAARVLPQVGSYSEKLSDDLVKFSKGAGAAGPVRFTKGRQLLRPLWILELDAKSWKMVKSLPIPAE